MPLCTQGQVEDTMHIVFTDSMEPTIVYLIEGASQAIKSFLNREIEEATYTNELYDSPWGRAILQLRNYPVTAVAEIQENTVVLVEAEGFQWYSSGKVVRMNGSVDSRWQIGRKIIDVTYTAGYATGSIPDDIEMICAGIVARHFRAGADFAATPAAAGPVRSVSLDGSDSIEYADPPDMGAVGHVAMLTEQDQQGLMHYQRKMNL